MDPDHVLVTRLQTLLLHVQESVSIVDDLGRVIVTTGCLSRLIGDDAGASSGRTLFDVVLPREFDRAVEMRRRVLASPTVPITGEFLVPAADGRHDVVSVRAVNLLDDPMVRGVVVVARNTERRQIVGEVPDLIDIDVLDGLVSDIGDRAVVVEVVAAFLGELDRRMAAVTDALDAGDIPADDVVGSLVASSRLLGLRRLAAETSVRAAAGSGSGSLCAVAEATRDALAAWIDAGDGCGRVVTALPDRWDQALTP